MYVMSFKLNRTKLLVCALICIVIAFAIIWAVPKVEMVNASQTSTMSVLKTNEDRVAFLKSFGWEVQTEPSEVMELIIPTNFDSVYEKYNSIQKTQSYDLLKYKGKRVKRWTYKVTNYPGKPDEVVNANLLILDDKVIGGDISSTSLAGFIHGFSLPN